MSLGDIDSHLLQPIGIYLLPTYAVQLRTTADASTTPRGALKSRRSKFSTYWIIRERRIFGWYVFNCAHLCLHV